jgi:antagonist of KipI
MNLVQVIRAGLASSVQDLGRDHLRHYGVPIGGAADLLSHELANRLVGNPATAATLEMTLSGDELEWSHDSLIAITGADMDPVIANESLSGQSVPQLRPVLVSAGTRIRFQTARRGCRCYLAVFGGFDVPVVMESRATYLRAHLGGLNGRCLQAGDVLPIGSARQLNLAPNLLTPGTLQSVPWFVRPVDLPDAALATLHVLRGSHFERLSADSRMTFFEQNFVVSPQSDRMGYRLTGTALSHLSTEDMTTEGTTPGTIQLPPDGNPILLMTDSAPTGGYPRIGHVATCDHSLAAQLRPGQLVRFVEIDLETAQQKLREQGQQFERSLLFLTLQPGTNPAEWSE